MCIVAQLGVLDIVLRQVSTGGFDGTYGALRGPWGFKVVVVVGSCVSVSPCPTWLRGTKLSSAAFKNWNSNSGGGLSVHGFWLGFTTYQGHTYHQLQDLGSEVWTSCKLLLPMLCQGQVEFLVPVTMGMPLQLGAIYHAWRAVRHSGGTSRALANLQLGSGASGCSKGGHTYGSVGVCSLVQLIGQMDTVPPHQQCSRCLGGQEAQGTHVVESQVQGKGSRWGRPTSYADRSVDVEAGWVKVVRGPPGHGNDDWVGLPRTTCINRYSALAAEEMPLPEDSVSPYVAFSLPESQQGRFVGGRERPAWQVGPSSRSKRLGPVVAHRSLLEVRRLKNAARRRRRKWHHQFWYGASVVSDDQAGAKGIATTREGSYGREVPATGVAGATRRVSHLMLLLAVYWTSQDWLVYGRLGIPRDHGWSTRLVQDGELAVHRPDPGMRGSSGVERSGEAVPRVEQSPAGRTGKVGSSVTSLPGGPSVPPSLPMTTGRRSVSYCMGMEGVSPGPGNSPGGELPPPMAAYTLSVLEAIHEEHCVALAALTQGQGRDREGAQVAFIRLDEEQTRASAVAAESDVCLAALLQQSRVGEQQGRAGSRPPT